MRRFEFRISNDELGELTWDWIWKKGKWGNGETGKGGLRTTDYGQLTGTDREDREGGEGSGQIHASG